MAVTVDMILSDFGRTLPLDRRRRDALADYALRAAQDANCSPRKWVARQWDLADYEAKEVLRGNASEAIWERIAKHKNGHWPVTLIVMGAVIGQSFDAWIASERKRLRHEQQQLEANERSLVEMAGYLFSGRSVGADGSVGRAAEPTGDGVPLGRRAAAGSD